MVKLVIVGVLLIVLETSAFPRNFNATDSPSTYALGSGRYRGGVIFRNAPTFKEEGFKTTRRDSSITKLYRHRNTPQATIMEQMKGKAIFYHMPDEKQSQNTHSTFERKTGHSFKISEKTVNDTIKEVEEIMRANPQIPRLSRQEMINIIKNITNSHVTNLTETSTKTSLGQSREEYLRSLMLVMPFNTNNLSESMIQDLYTKPPITEIINTTPTTSRTTHEWKIVVDEMTTEPKESFTKGSTVTAATRPSTEYVRKTTGTTTPKPYSSTFSYTIPRDKFKNKRPSFGERQRLRTSTTTTTQKPTTTTEEPEDAVSKISFTTERATTIYQYPESTIARIRVKATKAPFIVTATSVTPRPFKRIPAQVTIPPPLKKDNVLIRDDVKELLASIGLFPLDQPGRKNESTTTTQKYIVTTTQPPFPMNGVNTLTPEMQTLLKSFGLLDNEIPSAKGTNAKQITQPPIFNPPPPEPTVDIGSYAAFKPLPTQGSLSSSPSNTARQTMGNDMKEFLASFGLLPEDTDTNSGSGQFTGSVRTQKSRKPNDFPTERKYDKIENDSLEEENDKENNTKAASALDLSIDTDMLPDDMKDVLQNLGLTPMLEVKTDAKQTDSNQTASKVPVFSTTTSTTTAQTTSPETFTASALTTRRLDSDITTENEPINTTDEIITSTTAQTTIEDEENATTEGHIFNPTETVHNNEDIEHLSKLLKTVRLLANGTSQEDVESLLGEDAGELLQSDEGKNRKEKMSSLDQAENPPDPLSLEELVQIINSAKNEVKRQQPANASNSDSSTNSTEENSTPQTIEAAESGDRSPSIDDLAASFGGSNGEEEDSELPAPPSRPNGLYFLLDWNSFLEVGEDNSRVNLRFAPKIGDSRNFLPVTVP